MGALDSLIPVKGGQVNCATISIQIKLKAKSTLFVIAYGESTLKLGRILLLM